MSSVNLDVKPSDFIRAIINEDLASGKHKSVVTRFPPEPNGHLHIGHAKSICLNFGLAKDYRGICHLRFDDTDPEKEDSSFEEAIQEMVHWLGFDWGDKLFHASDYFDQLYSLAVQLIQEGKAYVCSLNLEEIREYRGTVTEAGKDSPYRSRSIEENLDLFNRMKNGEFPDGAHVLRAKIRMDHSNMKMRDPLLYRIRHANHHMTGDKWCIYPMYDFAHCLSDSIEGITHSICTLEFENNRELYDWIIDNLDMPAKPRQYEFARLNINYTVMSKRKILQLVEGAHVSGWDDPRLLTLAGLRRRGYTAESIRKFCASVGIAKANSTVDMAQLEFAIRDDLNHKAPRVMAVLEPLKVLIKNYPEGKTEMLQASYWPEDVPNEGSRELPFSREIYIERSDFEENPPKGYFRLSPGGEVRLRHGYIVRCEDFVKDENGNVVELHCYYDEETPLGENPKDGRKVKGTIHWVNAATACKAEVRSYDRLFTVDSPGVGKYENYLDWINKDSLKVYTDALLEPALLNVSPEEHFQFERQGYFVSDQKDCKEGHLVFNKVVGLKDSWAKKVKAPLEKKKEHSIKKVAPPAKVKEEKAPLILNKREESLLKELQEDYSLSKEFALILAQKEELAEFFKEAHQKRPSPLLVNWVVNEVQRSWKLQNEMPLSAEHLNEVIQAIEEEIISTKIAKDVYAESVQSKTSPLSLIEKKGLKQVNDLSFMEPVIDELMEKHQDVVADIRAGRTKRMGFFVGQAMARSEGKANPKALNEMIKKKLGI